ncbi:MAG: ApbE family protein [Gammaproteobacteria bacterium]|nr:ApbE family protein [Gammaproteobacteria bacterium]
MSVLISTLLLSFLVILLVIAGMSVGVMNGRRAISGSCGGLGGGGCELCSGNCKKKREEMRSIPDGESA